MGFSAALNKSDAASFQPLSDIILHAKDTFLGVFDVRKCCCLLLVYAGTSGTDAIAYAVRGRRLKPPSRPGAPYPPYSWILAIAPFDDVSFSHSRDERWLSMT
jgi:hypothetical protein